MTGGHDYLDLRQLEQLISLDGTGDLLADLATTFLRTGPEQLQALTTAALQGDADAVRLTAHTLRGSAGTFGGRDLARLACAVEEDALDGRVPDEASLGQLRTALDTTLDRLSDRVSALRG